MREHDRAFNPFRILRLERYEIRHVNTLAWLLDPTESHGLGAAFFNLFMRTVCDEAEATDVLALVAISQGNGLHLRREVITKDLARLNASEIEATVSGTLDIGPEAATPDDLNKRLDLLVQGEGWVLGIEAKIASLQSPGQLASYRSALQMGAKDARCIFVYLNCDEEDTPDDSEWVHVTWQKGIVQPLRQLLDGMPTHTINPPALDFIRDYLLVIEEQSRAPDSLRESTLTAIVDGHSELLGDLRNASTLDKDVQTLVRLNSKLISELQARYLSDAHKRFPAIRQMLENFPGIELARSSSSVLRFLPKEWSRYEWLHKEGRPYPSVICELFNEAKKGVRFKLMICDLGEQFSNEDDFELRRALYDRVAEAGPHFFGRAFLRNGSPRSFDAEFFGVTQTGWMSCGDVTMFGTSGVEMVRQAMERDFLPAVNALSGLLEEVDRRFGSRH